MGFTICIGAATISRGRQFTADTSATGAVDATDELPEWSVVVEPIDRHDAVFADPFAREANGERSMSISGYVETLVKDVQPHSPVLAQHMNALTNESPVDVDALRGDPVDELRAARAEDFERVRDERDKIASVLEDADEWRSHIWNEAPGKQRDELLREYENLYDAYIEEEQSTYEPDEYDRLATACRQLWLCDALDRAAELHGEDAAIRVF